MFWAAHRLVQMPRKSLGAVLIAFIGLSCAVPLRGGNRRRKTDINKFKEGKQFVPLKHMKPDELASELEEKDQWKSLPGNDLRCSTRDLSGTSWKASALNDERSSLPVVSVKPFMPTQNQMVSTGDEPEDEDSMGKNLRAVPGSCDLVAQQTAAVAPCIEVFRMDTDGQLNFIAEQRRKQLALESRAEMDGRPRACSWHLEPRHHTIPLPKRRVSFA